MTSAIAQASKERIADLNRMLATELVATMRARHHHFIALGHGAAEVAAGFLARSNEKLAQVDRLAQRLVTLGGAPNFHPSGLTRRSHADYSEAEPLVDMLHDDVEAEERALAVYRTLIVRLGEEGDEATRNFLVELYSVAETQLAALQSLLADATPAPPEPPFVADDHREPEPEAPRLATPEPTQADTPFVEPVQHPHEHGDTERVAGGRLH